MWQKERKCHPHPRCFRCPLALLSNTFCAHCLGSSDRKSTWCADPMMGDIRKRLLAVAVTHSRFGLPCVRTIELRGKISDASGSFSKRERPQSSYLPSARRRGHGGWDGLGRGGLGPEQLMGREWEWAAGRCLGFQKRRSMGMHWRCGEKEARGALLWASPPPTGSARGRTSGAGGGGPEGAQVAAAGEWQERERHEQNMAGGRA